MGTTLANTCATRYGFMNRKFAKKVCFIAKFLKLNYDA